MAVFWELFKQSVIVVFEIVGYPVELVTPYQQESIPIKLSEVV